MNLYNTNLSEFTFNDVVNFCGLNIREGIQLDYKEALPNSKRLSRLIAAFSNTRGGVIIIGIREDNVTGLPVEWRGIPFERKHIETINQSISLVQPLPNCEIITTDIKDNSAFVLIRIFEGFNTPYYVFNDPNIWIKTGDLRSKIDLASARDIERLFGKRNEAAFLRNNAMIQSEEYFIAALRRAERERRILIRKEKDDYTKESELLQKKGINTNPFQSQIYQNPFIPSPPEVCKIVLLPYYPHESFSNPIEIKDFIENSDQRKKSGFPGDTLETLPQGIINFSWTHSTGLYSCFLAWANGLLFLRRRYY